MKLNSTIGLTLILLASMLVAGLVSAVAGMSLGREALKGITQPDTRPTNNLANRKGSKPRKDELLILPEDKILTTVKARIQGGKGSGAAAKVTPTVVKREAAQAKFPIVSENKGVALEIKSVQQQGDSLVVTVSLRNNTDDPVKFLYSFLEVKNEQGQALSTSTEGLPSDLPSDGEAYSGTIRIPSTSVDKAQKLSLLLTDYPDQQIKLQVLNIPVIQ
ncbi:MAG: hypothetical protein HC866_15235 [Leptolyngbyaceae cyanobacterium RU_5_1]|nr:hypothetical protein [Leptolyngbyaceae cyanobacterium RU_5_1]